MNTPSPLKSQAKSASRDHFPHTTEALIAEFGSLEIYAAELRYEHDAALYDAECATKKERSLADDETSAVKSARRALRKVELEREKFLSPNFDTVRRARWKEREAEARVIRANREYDVIAKPLEKRAATGDAPAGRELELFKDQTRQIIKAMREAREAVKNAEQELDNAKSEADMLFRDRLAAETRSFETERVKIEAAFKIKRDAAANAHADAKARADAALRALETFIEAHAKAFALEAWTRRLPNASAEEIDEIARHFPANPKSETGVTEHSMTLPAVLLAALNAAHGWSSDLEGGYGFSYAYVLRGGSYMNPEEEWRKTGGFEFRGLAPVAKRFAPPTAPTYSEKDVIKPKPRAPQITAQRFSKPKLVIESGAWILRQEPLPERSANATQIC